MRNVWIGIGFALILALVGWSQCVELSCLSFDGPSVMFKLCAQVAGATCSNVPKPPPTPSDTVRCSVSEGASGTVDLTVNRTAPGGFMGGIVLTGSVPGGWPTFTPVSKSGSGNMSLTAQYRFTVPVGTAGRTFELKFKAVADGCYGELVLTVILDVAAKPSGPQLYGPFTGTTDDAGKFTVSIPGLPNNVTSGWNPFRVHGEGPCQDSGHALRGSPRDDLRKRGVPVGRILHAAGGPASVPCGLRPDLCARLPPDEGGPRPHHPDHRWGDHVHNGGSGDRVLPFANVSDATPRRGDHGHNRQRRQLPRDRGEWDYGLGPAHPVHSEAAPQPNVHRCPQVLGRGA